MPEPELAPTPLDQQDLETPLVDAPGTAAESSGAARGRALRDFLRPSRAQFVIAVVLAIFGLALTMQVRARADEEDYSSLRRSDLIQMVEDLSAESRRLEDEIADLQETRRQLQTGVDRQQVAREEAQRRLDVLSILGGTAAAEGRGIRITIDDPQAKVTPEILLNALEEMRDAGGEVIEINNAIRVVASTWTTRGPTGLIVDDQVVTRPILIEVIGDPHALSEAAKFRGGLVSEIEGQRVGGSVSIATDNRVLISSLHTPKANQFARPA